MRFSAPRSALRGIACAAVTLVVSSARGQQQSEPPPVASPPVASPPVAATPGAAEPPPAPPASAEQRATNPELSAPPPPATPPPPPSTYVAPPPTVSDSAEPAAPASALPLCDRRATPSPCTQPADAYKHDGFYLRFANGTEYVAARGDGPAGDASVSALGGTTLFAFGGTIGDGLVLAGALRGASAEGDFHGAPEGGRDDATFNAILLGPLVDWYPDATGGWHVGGMVGLGVLSIDSVLVDASGGVLGGAIQGGHDWWIGPQWSLGLMAVASATTSAWLKDEDGDDTGYRFGAYSVGLQGSILHH